jgi:hypothetical protein
VFSFQGSVLFLSFSATASIVYHAVFCLSRTFFIFLNFFFEEIHLRSAGHINSVLLCVPLSDSSGVCCAVMLLAVNGERGI